MQADKQECKAGEDCGCECIISGVCVCGGGGGWK